ncbi:MAG: exosortase-associated EpsI family protein [Armatimonadota bacterium]
MKKTLWILSGLLTTIGLGYNFAPRPPEKILTEDQVIAMLPTKVGRFQPMLKDGEKVSYKMDKSSYDILKPWGICARVFVNGNESYDVVAIASNSKESFHDPQICFSAQGWRLSNQREDVIKTKTHGDIPITLVDMEQGGNARVAMYFFRLNKGYYGNMSKVKRDMLMYLFTNRAKDEGAFIRVIPTGTVDVAKMKLFVADWVDAANQTSKGYY